MKKKNTKILVIDDELEFSADLQTALEAKDYRVVTANNSGQAQEMVRHEKPELIILGTIVPRGDAFRLHQWLKQSPNFGDLPLIVIDAPVEKQLIRGWRREEGLQLEAEGLFRKPIEPVALFPRIEKLLDRVTRRIKVLVADDHAVVREGIRVLLSLQKDMQVIWLLPCSETRGMLTVLLTSAVM